MFLGRNKKNIVNPCKPQFYYIKVGFKGVKIYIMLTLKSERYKNFIYIYRETVWICLHIKQMKKQICIHCISRKLACFHGGLVDTLQILSMQKVLRFRSYEKIKMFKTETARILFSRMYMQL